jgi:hypothetical protein
VALTDDEWRRAEIGSEARGLLLHFGRQTVGEGRSLGKDELRGLGVLLENDGVRSLDHRLGVGGGGLGQACQCHNAGHGQHEGGGDAAGHDHACLTLAPAEVVDEGLHMRLRRGACDLRFERQAGFEARRVAEVVAVAGLSEPGEGEVLEKEAKLLVVRCERPQPCPE